MAFPTALNSQITDSVTSTNPAEGTDTASLAAHYTALAQSVSALHRQATLAQRHLAELHTALTQAGVQFDAAPHTDMAQAAPATAVNPQITDAVTQANVKVLGDAPAMAMGNLFIATSQALSNAAHNAVDAQQQAYMTAQAATTQGIATLYGIDTASTGKATSEIYE